MSGAQVTVEWLVSKWKGVRETVPRSRVKQLGDLDIGMEVPVTYKRGRFRARIIGLQRPQRTAVQNHRFIRIRNAATCRKLPRADSVPRHERTSLIHAAPTTVPDNSDNSSVDDFEESLVFRADPTDASSSFIEDPDSPVISTADDSFSLEDADDEPEDATPSSPEAAEDVPGSPAPLSPEAAEDVPDSAAPLSPEASDEIVEDATSSSREDARMNGTSSSALRMLTLVMEDNRRLNAENRELMRKNYELERQLDELRREKELPPVKTAPEYHAMLPHGKVMLGTDDAAVVIDKDVYDHAYDLSSGPKELIIKLLDKVVSAEELARSNFHGGAVYTGKEWKTKEALRKNVAFRGLLIQAELQFPGQTTGTKFSTELRDAVNAKCRKSAFKLGRQ